jgi:hypothetical protein
MNFCPADTVSLERCQLLNPSPRVFQGTGRVNAVLMDVPNDPSNCPVSIHIRGTGTNGFGVSMEFTGHLVRVRDSNSGQCRTITLEVEGTQLP